MDNITIVSRKEILDKAGKNTFRFLHGTDGYDFTKPVILNRFSGTFTIKKLWSIIPHKDYDYNVCVLVNVPNSRYEREKKYYIARICGENSFDIELKASAYFGWYTIPNTFYTKGMFTELRKRSDIETYLIAQRKDYQTPITEKKPYSVGTLDDNVRYIFNKEQYAYTANMEKKYISELHLRDTTGKGKEIVYRVPQYYRKDLTFYDILDNSGYYVYNRRAELKRRAAALRAEREKAAYNEYDTTGMIEKAVNAAEKTKSAIIEKIQTAADYNSMYALHRKLYDIAWLYYDIELFTEKINNKKFPSIPACENSLQKIIDKAEKIETEEQ